MTKPDARQGSGKIIVRGDPEIEEIIPVFLQNRHEDVESLSKALEDRDFEIIQTLGHSMKGSGGGSGFHAISEIGSTLEQAARDQSSGRVRRLVEELTSYLHRVEVVYE